MADIDSRLLDKLPDCPEPGCVRKAHGARQGVHVYSVYAPREAPALPSQARGRRHHDLRPEHDVVWHDIQDGADLHALLSVLQDAGDICFDLETMASLSPSYDWLPSSRLVSASFTVEEGVSYVVPLSHPEGARRWESEGGWRGVARRLFNHMLHARLIGHNLKYDVRWAFAATGVDLNERAWFDTMDAQHVLDENLPKGLKTMAQVRLGVPPWADVDLMKSEEAEWSELAKYNALDTAYTWALVAPLRAELEENPALARLFGRLLRPVSRALTRMERNGMQLDVPALEDRARELERSIEDREWRMWERVPPALKEEYQDPTVRAWEDDEGFQVAVPGIMPSWNPQSNFFGALMEALEVPVIERSEKTGKPSWAEGVMKRLALEVDEPLVNEHLEYRHEVKELTSFVRPWMAMRSPGGKLYPTFKPANVSTGRLSASDPNPQQISKKLKRYFPAPEGWWVVQADYAQIELRIVAEIGNIEPMLTAFRQGRDLHTIMAARITGKSEADVTPDERYIAKPVNFGFLYGMGAAKFVDFAYEEYGIIFTYERAAEVRQAFFDTWLGIEDYHERQERLALANGYVRSPLGRRRNLPDVFSRSRFHAAQAIRQAINAPVQGFASDLMLLAIIELDRRLDPDIARLVCTVHDSLVLYGRKGRMREVVDTVADAMLHPPLERFRAKPLRVPLAVDFEIGPEWGTATHELTRSTLTR